MKPTAARHEGKAYLRIRARIRLEIGRGERAPGQDERADREQRSECPRPHQARPPRLVAWKARWPSASSAQKKPCGSVTPLAASLSRKCGFRPVELSGERSRVGPPTSLTLLGRPGDEDVLERDHVGLHSEHLGDVADPSRAVDEARDLHEEVEGAGHLLADRAQRQVDARREHEGLEAAERVARRVRVDRRQRALVAGVHRLEHVQRLGATDLADDDPVGAHSQGVADELADAHLSLALDVGRAGLEREDVILLKLELGRILDRDDALVVRHERRQGVERRRLAGSGTARDENVELPLDARCEEVRRLGVSVPKLIRSSIV